MEKLHVRIETTCASYGTTNVEADLPTEEMMTPGLLRQYLEVQCDILVKAAQEKYEQPTGGITGKGT